MEDFLGYRFLLLLLIVVLNGFFALAEMALVSARQSRLRELAAGGNVGATSALSLLERPERLLSIVQVGVTLASLGAGWAGEETVYRLLFDTFGPLTPPGFVPVLRGASFAISFLLLTYIMVVFGEVVPKNLGIKNSEWLATAVAPPLLVVQRIASPFVFVLERSSAAIARLLGLGGGQRGSGHSLEELRLIASSVRAAGRMSVAEEAWVNRVLDLPHIAVREVMVPRNDVVSVSADAPLEQVLRTFSDTLFARLPVYESKPENIIGILHYKDLLALWQRHLGARRMNQPPPPFRLRSLLRRHLIVPESKPLTQMIDDLRHAHAHMALVVDEFGTIVGLVTLEDVVEQVFGEIEDEHDVRRPRPPVEGAVIELEGTISIRDLETQYGIELPTNAGFETLAGFLLFRLGYIPSPGDSVTDDGRRFTILAMERNRIAKVRIERIAEEAVSTDSQ